MLTFGAIALMENGPSFCTPIFRSPNLDDNKIYVQSSSDLKNIENFIRIGRIGDFAENYYPIFANKSFDTSGEFVFCYRSLEGSYTVGAASELLSELDRSFSLYDDYPLFQLSVVRLSGNLRWIERLKEVSQKRLYELLDLRKKFSIDANLIERADRAVKSQNLSIHLKNFDALPKSKVGALFASGFVESSQARFLMSDKIEYRSELVEVASLAIAIVRRGGPKNSKELLFLLMLYMVDVPSRERKNPHL